MKKRFASDSHDVPRRRMASADVPARADTDRRAFRRNRTLIGSTSGKITSSNEIGAEFQSPRAHVHHLSQLRRRILRYLTMTAAAIITVFLLMSQLIATVNISASDAVLPTSMKAAYQARFDDYLQTRPVERLRFWLKLPDLTAYMQQKYPAIATIDVEPIGELGAMNASVSLRQPIARWKMGDSDKFVDKNGVVFDYNAFSPPEISIVDKSGVPVSALTSVASSSFLTFVGRVVGDAAERGLTVTSAIIPELSIREVDVRVKGVPYRFKMTTDRSAGEQVEDMSRIIRYFKSRDTTPDYADVRIKGKAYYR